MLTLTYKQKKLRPCRKIAQCVSNSFNSCSCKPKIPIPTCCLVTQERTGLRFALAVQGEMSMDDCHIIGSQRKLRPHPDALAMVACFRLSTIYRPTPHETIQAKLPSTLPVGVEPVLRSSACSPTLPRKLVRWVVRRCSACTHQWLIGGMRWLHGSNHDRMQTVTSGSMSTMTSWCVKCSNTTILNFFDVLLAIARYTATPSCFLLFE